ncbi:MAG TPA: RNA polymerase sigma factor [Candidatus Polarisedimenticolaceae bacterium]|nr:RNA polymerase sigma factor [Candidatus Polarisedimenticolaceae bacterium]
MPPSGDEQALIRAAAAGDRRAFDELVRLKRERVVRTAYQITGDLDDALDVAQGVFLKLWRGLERFDPRRRFDTWVYRITVNAAIDMLRSRGARGTVQPLPDEIASGEPTPETDPARELDRREVQRAFLRLAARLAPRQRAVFVLREIEGLGTSEIAAAMGVTESTVRNHLLQARRTLREGLEREYPGLVPRGSVASDQASGEDER